MYTFTFYHTICMLSVKIGPRGQLVKTAASEIVSIYTEGPGSITGVSKLDLCFEFGRGNEYQLIQLQLKTAP